MQQNNNTNVTEKQLNVYGTVQALAKDPYPEPVSELNI